MTKTPKLNNRFKRAVRKANIYLLIVLTVTVAVITLFHSVALDYLYMYVEIINMENIQQSLDKEDPFSYDYFKHIDNVSNNNYYLLEVFDKQGNTVCTNASDFFYSGEMTGDANKSYAVGEVKRNIGWVNPNASVDYYYYDDDNVAYFRYRSPMSNGDTIRLWVPAFQIGRNAEIAANFLSFFAIVSCIITAIIIIMYNIKFSHPIAQMSDIAESMSKLDFSKKCKYYSQADVKDLAMSINSLSSSLSSTLQELQEKNKKLSIELEHSALIDESRKSFIANVSHELKTPIAIIKGYAEGLQLGISDDPQTCNEYCNIILEESDKMNQIVLDLLNLEKIESGSYVPTLEIMDLGEFIEKQFSAFSMMFHENGIDAKNEVPLNIYVNSDKKTLLLVLQNFLSNAVSNIGKDKIIRIRHEDMGSNYRIYVFNSGDPISESEIDKIWYSFYKSNKKRKNEDLHFGLGLPTVKAVQQKLNKQCGVYNTPNGPCFWFDAGK